jgi:hypothetical protein
MVAKYDRKTLLPLLVATFWFLNLNFNGLIEVTQVDVDEDSIFGVMTSNDITLHGLLRNELNMFRHLHVKPKDYMLPLTWWKIHETWFPNVFFVVQQFLGVLGSQIEIDRIFNIIGVLTNFWCCKLGIDNLDKLVMIVKNSWANARIYWPWDEFLMEDASIIDENDTMLDATSYFTVGHELKYWRIWMFMSTLLYFLRTSFAINKMLEMLALVARCISQLNWLLLNMHVISSHAFNFH